MVQIRRVQGREEVVYRGGTFVLESESWTARLATPWLGVGWTYHRPRLIESGGASTRIHDHIMVARLAAVLLLILTVLVRKERS
jgi:hypothetical protein